MDESLPTTADASNVLPSMATSGQVIVFDGTNWTPDTITTGLSSETKTSNITTEESVTADKNITTVTGGMSTGWCARISDDCWHRNGTLTINKFNGKMIASGGYANMPTFYNGDGTVFGEPAYFPLPGYYLSAWIACYNTNGMIDWIARIDGTDTYGPRVACDADGNIYVIGFMGQTGPLSAYSSNGTVFGTTVSSSGEFDCFLVSFTAAGIVRWITKIGGTTGDYPNDLKVYGSDLYITGSYTSSPLNVFNADGTVFGTSITNAGQDDAYLLKFNSDGFAQWLIRMQSTAWDGGISLLVDKYGVYLSARFVGDTFTVRDINDDIFDTLSKITTGATALIKCTHDGYVQWINKIDCRVVGAYLETYLQGYNDDIYGVVRYDSGPLLVYNSNGTVFTTLPLTSAANVGLVKYDKFGMVKFAYKISNADGSIANFTVNEFGLYIAGSFVSSTLAVDNFDGTRAATFNKGSGDNQNAFLIQYNHDGTLQFGTTVTGTDTYVTGMDVDKSDVYVGFNHQATSSVTLPSGQNTISVPVSTAQEHFVAKYALTSTMTLADPTANIQKTINFNATSSGARLKIALVTPLIIGSTPYNYIYLSGTGSTVTIL